MFLIGSRLILDSESDPLSAICAVGFELAIRAA